MADEAPKTGPDKRSFLVKYMVPSVIVIFLSLITWSFFYMMQMALTPADTSFVVGFWLLVVFGVRWMIGRIGRGRTRTVNGKSI